MADETTLLLEDVEDIIDRFNNDKIEKTDWHKTNYAKENGKRLCITNPMIGSGGSGKKLVLAFQIGGDGKPVYEIPKGHYADPSEKNIDRFFSFKENHYHLPLPLIIRLCHFFGLNFYQTLAMVIKSKYEKIVSSSTSNYYFFDYFYEFKLKFQNQEDDFYSSLHKSRNYSSKTPPSNYKTFPDYFLFLIDNNKKNTISLENLTSQGWLYSSSFDAHEKKVLKEFRVRKNHNFTLSDDDISEIFYLFIGHINSGNNPEYYSVKNDSLVTDSEVFYDLQDFKDLVIRMIIDEFYLKSYNHEMLNDFINNEPKDYENRKNGSTEEKTIYYFKYIEWSNLNIELENISLELEKTKLIVNNIKHEYFSMFCSLLLQLEELKIKFLKISKKQELKVGNPNLSDEELDNQVNDIFIDENNNLLEYKENEIKYKMLRDDLSNKIYKSISSDEINDYNKKTKKLFKEIIKLIHPAALMQNPDFRKLSETQKNELEKLFCKTLEINDNEISFDSNLFIYSNRSLDIYKLILSQSKKTLKNAGLNIKTRNVIEGKSIQERIEWLNNEIDLIIKINKSIKTQKSELILDKEFIDKKYLLEESKKDSGFKNDYEDHLKDEIKLYEKLIEAKNILYSKLIFIDGLDDLKNEFTCLSEESELVFIEKLIDQYKEKL